MVELQGPAVVVGVAVAAVVVVAVVVEVVGAVVVVVFDNKQLKEIQIVELNFRIVY